MVVVVVGGVCVVCFALRVVMVGVVGGVCVVCFALRVVMVGVRARGGRRSWGGARARATRGDFHDDDDGDGGRRPRPRPAGAS